MHVMISLKIGIKKSKYIYLIIILYSLGINIESIKLKTNPKQNIIHPIPPHNGYGTEEDSMLNVKYLNFQHKGRE